MAGFPHWFGDSRLPTHPIFVQIDHPLTPAEKSPILKGQYTRFENSMAYWFSVLLHIFFCKSPRCKRLLEFSFCGDSWIINHHEHPRNPWPIRWGVRIWNQDGENPSLNTTVFSFFLISGLMIERFSPAVNSPFKDGDCHPKKNIVNHDDFNNLPDPKIFPFFFRVSCLKRYFFHKNTGKIDAFPKSMIS